jgi:hypothetical protein
VRGGPQAEYELVSVDVVDAEAQRDVFDRVSEEDQVTGRDDPGRPLVRRDGAGVEPADSRSEEEQVRTSFDAHLRSASSITS